MPDWAAILKVLNGNGLVVGVFALALLAGTVWQGCEHRAADRATDRAEAMYEAAVERAAVWQMNAEKWEDAARQCGAATEALRYAARIEQEQLQQEMRTLRAHRRASELEIQRLKEAANDESVHELLRRVQAL